MAPVILCRCIDLNLHREIGPYSSCRCPRRYDIEWLKRGGGMIGPHQPPAHRFSAGQKLVYWIVVLGEAPSQ
jgi:cytochrome b subunit of formate dehydrogenase